MPRKKATKKEDTPVATPKRTHRSTAKRVATAASTPAPNRPRIMSSEEKRQLILAHAAMRQPVDTVQRFSLWTGVAVCILAITIGWVYTMRQSIAGAIGSENGSAEEQMDYGEIKASIQSNISDMVDKIDNLQDDQLIQLKEQAALLQTIDAAKTATSSESATSTENTGRSDLFQPTDQSTDTPTSNDFQIPPGVTIDKSNVE